MQLKTSLHIHTREDKKDGHMIDYSIYDLIDEAEKNEFKVLGFTPHQKFVFKEEFAEYAQKKGILLIPGIERSLGRFFNNHVVILNCDKTIEKVRSLKQLIKYKKEHQEIFILAPHPTYSRFISIGSRNLKKYIDLFDAIEYSAAYSKKMNFHNKKATAIAFRYHKPIIATADVHVLARLKSDFAFIDTDDFTINGIFNAIKEEQFTNITEPKKFLSLMMYYLHFIFKYSVKFVKVKILNLKNKDLAVMEESV
jgi:predicted metal-dependent phosphoesterase TrpH